MLIVPDQCPVITGPPELDLRRQIVSELAECPEYRMSGKTTELMPPLERRQKQNDNLRNWDLKAHGTGTSQRQPEYRFTPQYIRLGY